MWDWFIRHFWTHVFHFDLNVSEHASLLRLFLCHVFVLFILLYSCSTNSNQTAARHSLHSQTNKFAFLQLRRFTFTALFVKWIIREDETIHCSACGDTVQKQKKWWRTVNETHGSSVWLPVFIPLQLHLALTAQVIQSRVRFGRTETHVLSQIRISLFASDQSSWIRSHLNRTEYSSHTLFIHRLYTLWRDPRGFLRSDTNMEEAGVWRIAHILFNCM